MARRKPKIIRTPWPAGTALEWIDPKPYYKDRLLVVVRDEGEEKLLVTNGRSIMSWPERAAELKPVDLPEPP